MMKNEEGETEEMEMIQETEESMKDAEKQLVAEFVYSVSFTL